MKRRDWVCIEKSRQITKIHLDGCKDDKFDPSTTRINIVSCFGWLRLNVVKMKNTKMSSVRIVALENCLGISDSAMKIKNW